MGVLSDKAFLVTGNGITADLHIVSAIASGGGRVTYLLPDSHTGQLATSKLAKVFAHYKHPEALCNVRMESFPLLDRDMLRDVLRECQNVIHVQAFHESDFASVEELWRHNVLGARTLCEVALEVGVCHMTVISPVQMLGANADGRLTDEGFQYIAKENRGEGERSLYRREMEFAKVAEMGMRVTSLLTGLPVGPGGRLTDELDGLTGLAVADVTTGFTDARDLAEMTLQLSDGEESWLRLVCVGFNATYAEVRTELRPVPFTVAQRLRRRLREVLPWTRNNFGQATDFSTESVRFSSEKIIELTGREFRPLSDAAYNCMIYDIEQE